MKIVGYGSPCLKGWAEDIVLQARRSLLAPLVASSVYLEASGVKSQPYHDTLP